MAVESRGATQVSSAGRFLPHTLFPRHLSPYVFTSRSILRSGLKRAWDAFVAIYARFFSAIHTCTNHHRDPKAYLDALPLARVEEIHLAGFAEDRDGAGTRLLIDAHGSPVATAVWNLYRHVLERTGPVATLIEWDNDVPPFERLVEEAGRAEVCLVAAAEPAGEVHA